MLEIQPFVKGVKILDLQHHQSEELQNIFSQLSMGRANSSKYGTEKNVQHKTLHTSLLIIQKDTLLFVSVKYHNSFVFSQ